MVEFVSAFRGCVCRVDCWFGVLVASWDDRRSFGARVQIQARNLFENASSSAASLVILVVHRRDPVSKSNMSIRTKGELVGVCFTRVFVSFLLQVGTWHSFPLHRFGLGAYMQHYSWYFSMLREQQRMFVMLTQPSVLQPFQYGNNGPCKQA